MQRYALDDWMEEGNRALRVMDKHLSNAAFFAGERSSIADIALYAYTHRAQECDFDLRGFPAIRDWLARVESEPGARPDGICRASPANSSGMTALRLP